MPPKSSYRYNRYSSNSGNNNGKSDERAAVAATPTTPTLSPLHQRRHPSANEELDVSHKSPVNLTQLRPRLPRTSISKIPRHVQGAGELYESAAGHTAGTPLQKQQHELDIIKPSSPPYHQIESSDDQQAAPALINIAKSKYLTFSKDQATSHFKQLQEELSAGGIDSQQRQQPQQRHPALNHYQQQDHQQMAIDISDRQTHRHFRRRRDEQQQLVSQVDNVYGNLLTSEYDDKTVSAAAARTTPICNKPRELRDETQVASNNEKQVRAQTTTSQLVRPRPLDRLSKQQVIVDSVMHDDKCDVDQFIDVVGLDESDNYGGDRGGSIDLERQVVKHASTRLPNNKQFTRHHAQPHQLQQPQRHNHNNYHQHQQHQHQHQHQQQPICEAFIMTGQSMLKLSCNETETENNEKQQKATIQNKSSQVTTNNTTAITAEKNDYDKSHVSEIIVDDADDDQTTEATLATASSQSQSHDLSPLANGPVEQHQEHEPVILLDAIHNNNNRSSNSCPSVRTIEEAPGLALSGDILCNEEEARDRREVEEAHKHRTSSRSDEAADASERAARKHEQAHPRQQNQRQLFADQQRVVEPQEQKHQPSEQADRAKPQIFEYIEPLNHHHQKPAETMVASQLEAMDSQDKSGGEPVRPAEAAEVQVSCHDRESARRLAKRLYNLSGFKRSDVCHHLAKNNPFSQMVAEEYLCLFDFRATKLDAALRKFLSKLQLNGETQERERVLSQFSQRYFDCNKEKFPSSDTIQTLVCAMILLNTDLHGNHFDKKLRRNKRTKLSLGAFIDGLNNSIASETGQCGNGQSANLASQISTSNINPVSAIGPTATPYTFPRHLLVDLYESIKKRPLKCGEDKCDMTSYEAELDRIYSQQLGIGNNSRSSTLPTRRFAPGSHAPSSTLSVNSRRQMKQGLGRMHSSENDVSIEFKSGFLNRKRTFEAHRRPTSKGRRGWRRIFVILKDLRLIIRYNQEEQQTEEGDKQQLTAKQLQLSSKLKKQMIARDMKNTVKLHHAFAKRCPSYTKREYVFQVLFADQSEMLMQANSEQEMDAWIDTINFASACLSSPALPTAVSNSKRYLQRYQSRSILPASYTKLSYWEQLIDHEERLQRLKQELEDHLNEAPNTRNADKRSKSEFIERIAYLRLDIERYSVYVDLMRRKSNSAEAIILSKHPQIASLTPSDEMIQNLPSFAPPKLDEDPEATDNTVTRDAL